MAFYAGINYVMGDTLAETDGLGIDIQGDSNSDPLFLIPRNRKAYYLLLQEKTGRAYRINATAGRTMSKFTGDNSQVQLMFEPSADQQLNHPVLPRGNDFGWLLINVGVNDTPQPFDMNTKALFKTSYRRVLEDFCLEKGWRYNQMALINVGIRLDADQYILDRTQWNNEVISELCAEYGCIEVDWHAEQTSWDDKAERLGDTLHYDNIGHQRMCDLIISTLNLQTI